MGILDGLTESDANAPLSERLKTDRDHYIVALLAALCGWVVLLAYLLAFWVLQVVQFRAEPTWRVAGDTGIDAAYTHIPAAMGYIIVVTIVGFYPAWYPLGLVCTAASAVLIFGCDRLRR